MPTAAARPWMLIAALVLLSLALLASCGGRPQHAADAIAGVDALERISADRAQAAPIAAGTRAYVAATAGLAQADLPPATRSAEDILGDPPAYQAAAELAEQQAATGLWSRLAAWTGGAALAALALAKAIPGAHRPALVLLDGLLSNRTDRETRRAREEIQAAATALSRAALALHPELLDQVPAALRPALAPLAPTDPAPETLDHA